VDDEIQLGGFESPQLALDSRIRPAVVWFLPLLSPSTVLSEERTDLIGKLLFVLSCHP
jgi:hypothetical protein